ncbi:MAG: hypothetical protein CL946_09120 [Ectothiorhodospiraceae bacterium]|nr:hypothetical protein [Ectothiorhodospiraceae bacterium]
MQGFKTQKRSLILLADVLVLLVYILGGYMTANKPYLGVQLAEHQQSDFGPIVDTVYAGDVLRSGDVLLAIDGINLERNEDVEQIVDGLQIGNQYNLNIQRNASPRVVRVELLPYYGTGYVIIQSIAALLFFILGMYVAYQRPNEKPALLFHHLAMSIGGIVMLTSSQYTQIPLGLGHVVRGLFPASYLLSSAFLLHFSLDFPRPRSVPKAFYASMYSIVALFSLAGLYSSIRATTGVDLTHAGYYYTIQLVGEMAISIASVAAIGIFIYSHNTSKEIADRIQLKWVLYGTSICVFTFLVLWEIPNNLLVKYIPVSDFPWHFRGNIIPEEVLLISIVFAAVGMAVALLRFRAFDIEVLVRRSTVYGIVFGSLIIVYLIGLVAIWNWVDSNNEITRFILYTIVMALNLILFLPARGFVQRVLDRHFYRIRYNFREALGQYTNSINKGVSEKDVAEAILENTQAFFNPTKALLLRTGNDELLRVLGHRGVGLHGVNSSEYQTEYMVSRSNRPLALPSAIEAEVDYEPIDRHLAQRLDISLIVPMVSDAGQATGLLVLGEKRSQYKYSIEDVELLRQAGTQAALHIDRIALQHELWAEQQEAERLEELNRLKSYFVSTVSHDLKTPITSVKIFAELLREQTDPTNTAAEKYSNVIEGECDRLTRLINNVLDYAKIEKGVKTYNLSTCRLDAVVQKVLDITEYQLKMSGFAYDWQSSSDTIYVEIDEDAIIQAVTNLITNAIKYSGEQKSVRLRTYVEDSYAAIEVKDNGIGISQEDLEHIFEPYYRASEVKVSKNSGTGLGLALVQHTIEAHQGYIDIESEPGEGTCITLYIPLKAQHETNTDY